MRVIDINSPEAKCVASPSPYCPCPFCGEARGLPPLTEQFVVIDISKPKKP